MQYTIAAFSQLGKFVYVSARKLHIKITAAKKVNKTGSRPSKELQRSSGAAEVSHPALGNEKDSIEEGEDLRARLVNRAHDRFAVARQVSDLKNRKLFSPLSCIRSDSRHKLNLTMGRT